MTESIEEKQDFLREAILEKGYDGNEFMSFLQQKRGDEIDLNDWSLSDLKLAVNDFIAHLQGQGQSDSAPPAQEEANPPQQPQEEAKAEPKLPDDAALEDEKKEEEKADQQEQPQPSPTKEQIPQPSPKKENVSIYNETKDSLQCITSKRTQFSQNENPRISLSLPEKIEGGLFSKSYVTYLVEALPVGTKVRKRYSDFEWLRNMMQSVYIGSVIPPIPKKNYGDRFNEVFISKRMRGLERFMNGLAVDPLMRDSPVLCDFLTIENESDWSARKKAFDKMKRPVGLSELLSLDGKLKTEISAEKDMYFVNIKDNANNNEILIQKLLTSYKELIAAMNNISRIMSDVSNIWKALYENSTKYHEDKKTFHSYNIMSKLMQDWSESEKKQSDLINVELKEYFRYIKNEFISMKDLIAKVDTSKNNYKKAEEKLRSRKEDLFKRQEINKWDLPESEMQNRQRFAEDKEYAFFKMLPKETMNVQNLRYTHGFYLNRIIDEYERISVLNGKRHSEQINMYCKRNTDIITDLHVGIADLLAFFAENTGVDLEAPTNTHPNPPPQEPNTEPKTEEQPKDQ